jgi:hypothetical protein
VQDKEAEEHNTQTRKASNLHVFVKNAAIADFYAKFYADFYFYSATLLPATRTVFAFFLPSKEES